VLALGWLMPSLLIACASIHFSPRYALPMLAAFAMILGALGEGVGALLRRARGRERCFAVGSGLALLVVCGAALHGSPPITPYPELAKATKIQTDLLASIKQRLGTASSDKSLSVDLPRKVMVSATAVDHLWMMAPWTLEAWLELEYPERRFEVRRVEAQGKSSQRVWSVMVIPRRLDTL
jgi:4-amino-4-deoxy-L-arabinose transferase-like glycosyltransferase